MSERLADIAARIDNVRQLDAVVTAMRGIAAARAQQSWGLLAGIEAYAATVSGAIGQALNFAAAAPPPLPERRPRGRVSIFLPRNTVSPAPSAIAFWTRLSLRLPARIS